MPLTIPKAGTISGRAPQLQVAEPQGAAVLAEFGNRMLEKGMQWKAEQRAMKTRQDELNSARDLGRARLKVEQIGDPAQIGPTWDAEFAEITSRYITPDTDPEVAAQLKLWMQGLGDRHAEALAEKTINLGRSQQEAMWIDMRQLITTEAATADPTTFQALIEMGEASIDERAAKGLIDPAKAAEEKQALRSEVYSARAMTAIEADPAAALAAAEAGEFTALGAEGVAKLKLDAKTEIDRRAAAQAKADEVASKARTDAVDKRLKTIGDLALDGRIAVDEADLANPEAQQSAEYPRARAAVELRKEIPGLRMMTVAELDTLIETETKRPIKEPWENERLTALRDLRDKKAAAYDTDPKAAAVADGMPVPEMPSFDPADPGAFAAALAAAGSFDGFLREKGYTRRSALFTTDQKAELKAVIDPKADAAPKVALAEAILQGTDGNPAPVLAAMEADLVFRRGLKVLDLTGDRALTEEILRGGQKVEGKTVVLPSRNEQVLAFDALTGGTFADAPALKEEMMAAAVALYADGAAGIDAETTATEGWIADGEAYALYQKSVQRLLGALPDDNGELTVGGIQEVNGALTVLPRGLSVRQVETGFDALSNRLMGGVLSQGYNMATADYSPSWDFSGADAMPPEARLAPFKAASLYGGIPDFGADPSAFFAGLSLHRLGETDVYEFRYLDRGRSVTVRQTDGYPYHFRLADLMREAGK